MDFLNIFTKRSKWFYVALGLLSMISGGLNAGILIFINKSITGEKIPFLPGYDWAVYAGLIAFSFTISLLFQRYLIRLTTDINFDFEVAILRKLKYAVYQDFEKLGEEKVFTAINDIRVLSNIPEIFMNVINAFIIIVCAFIYLFWNLWMGGLAILGIMAALLVFYILRNSAIEGRMNSIRNLQNSYYRYLHDLLHGFKEVKMSLIINQNIFSRFLEKNRAKGRELTKQTSTEYMTNELIGNYSWFLVLGVIMFGFPYFFGTTLEEIATFLVTILYLMGPVAVLIAILPTYTRVKIAFERLGEFNESITSQITNSDNILDPQLYLSGENDPYKDLAFDTIRFEGVKYEHYDEEKKQTFVLGPIDLEIDQGEILFITGGNGSGKSTFINILTGLYQPVEGNIYLNDIKVTPETYPAYSDKLSAIFTSSYLFIENYNSFVLSSENERLTGFIDLMKLNNIVKINDKKNRISRRLSKGQQKRLAMIYALMDNKNILVLDEWAAEQDPQFRAFFYKEFLRDLVEVYGKTVIAVTHDDEFFNCADRVLKFKYGKIAEDIRINGKEFALPAMPSERAVLRSKL